MTDCSNEKNTLKVNLENFQSISKASLEFVQGINIIVGQSNSGKSAILRAVKGAVLNPSGSQKYIKNKTNGFKVGIEYNGNTVEWSRTAKSPKYVVNGEDYLKVGNTNLTNILDNNKVGFVLDENKNLMNIESELELPFPFDKTNSELFKLFEKNIFCISDSTTITKLMKADEEEVGRQIETSKYELDRYKQKLEAISELEECIDINKLIEGRNKLSELNSDSQKIKLDISDLHAKIELGKLLSKVVPSVQVNDKLQQEYSSLSADVRRLEEIKATGSILKPISALTVNIKDMQEYKELSEAVMQLQQAEKLMLILRAIEAPTTRVINEEYTSLREDITTLCKLKEQAQNVQKDMEELKVKIQKLESEKSSFKVCPLCGKDL